MKAIKRNGSWSVRAYAGGILKRFTGPDKKTVMMQASAWVAENMSTSSRGTLSAAADKFFRDKEDILSPSTLRGYKVSSRLLEDKFPLLYHRECISITGDDLQGMVDDMLRKYHYSPKTVRNTIGFIGTVLRSKRVRTPIVDIPNNVHPDLNIPDEFTVKRVLKLAREKEDKQLWVCLSLTVCGALRRSEVCALRKEDIDFEEGTVHVQHDMVPDQNSKWVIKGTKTASSDRILQIPRKVLDQIQADGYYAKVSRRGDDPELQEPVYVCQYTPDQLYGYFTRLLKKNGIDHFRYHDLRHYCASMLHARKYPDKYIEMVTGHASDNILRRVYTHTLDDKAKYYRKRMLKDFERLVM